MSARRARPASTPGAAPTAARRRSARRTPAPFALVAVVLLLTAGSGEAARRTPLRVFAAASLRESFEALGREFEGAHPEIQVEFEFAGTAVLRAQIERGAPADVFASADESHAHALAADDLIESPRVFAHNRMVVITPPGGRVRTLADLARPGLRLVLAGRAVPAGRYARRALARMDSSGSFPPRFRSRVEANVVSEETGVRGVLAKVALGEADAGLVYATDARASRTPVRAIEIPDRWNVTAAYLIAPTARARGNRGAQAFVRAVLGARGRTLLRRHGFLD